MENPLKMDGDWGYPGYPGYPETPIWMEVSEDRGLSPKNRRKFSSVNYPALGDPLFMETHIYLHGIFM